MSWLDTETFEPKDIGPRPPMPEGYYPFMTTKTPAYGANYKGTGKKLTVEWECCHSDFDGYPIVHVFNVENESDMAVEMAKRSLKEVADAVGASWNIKRTSDLIGAFEEDVLNRKVWCKVETEKGKGTYVHPKTGETKERKDKSKIVAFMSEADAKAAMSAGDSPERTALTRG